MKGAVFTRVGRGLPSVVASLYFARCVAPAAAGAAARPPHPRSSRSSAHCPSQSFLLGLEIY